MSVRIIHGDMLAELPKLPADHFHACVTDPPYGLKFMDKAWDHGVPGVPFWESVYRVMKPGARLFAFGGTRTVHRLTCAIEDAGFQIHEQFLWLFASGFPKHRNAIKPAFEPIVHARKPLEPGLTIASHIAKHGTGGLNIDACRIESTDSQLAEKYASVRNASLRLNAIYGQDSRPRSECNTEPHPDGRWPANVLHDGSDDVMQAFAAFGDKSSPWIGNPKGRGAKGGKMFGGGDQQSTAKPEYADAGSAARFFYSAKADADDRLKSKHPTVKPVDLMRWLTRMVTPPGGRILDPFAGSGTTGMAAMAEGFDVVLVEKEADYVKDIQYRVDHVSGLDTPLFAEMFA